MRPELAIDRERRAGWRLELSFARRQSLRPVVAAAAVDGEPLRVVRAGELRAYCARRRLLSARERLGAALEDLADFRRMRPEATIELALLQRDRRPWAVAMYPPRGDT